MKRKIETMKVRIRSTFAISLPEDLRKVFMSGGSLLLDLKQGSRVIDLLRRLPSIGPEEEFDDMMLLVFVNGRVRGFDHVLESGDAVDLHLPVSGG
jgi:molybdopterin converting factor small subunit